MPDFGIKKKAYRPRWQEWPGYKTVVDEKSQLGIFPEQTESTNPDRGQGNLDAVWPVKEPQPREKERALPLPSNHDKKREKRIGPTDYNKPRKSPDRTLDVPGDEYGHPTKYDYNFPTRRTENLAFDLESLEPDDEDIYEEDPIDDQFMVEGAGPFPSRHQKNQGTVGRLVSRRWYRRHKPKKSREERMDYRMRGKRSPREKLKRKFRRKYPKRYTRRGIDPRTPAQKTKDWRQEQGLVQERKPKTREEREKERQRKRTAGMGLLAEIMSMFGFDMEAADWPVNWNTQVKKTKPPEQLDQNYGKGQSRGEGTPRKDPKKQKGESLRAPNLPAKPQRGLQWEIQPPAPGGLSYPEVTTMNPTDGSGKVIPMQWYTQEVNNTQAIPDGRQDRYLHNNNFEVKQATRQFIHELCNPEFGVGIRASFGPAGGQQRVAMTVGELLKRCDKKIKERSKEYSPKLARTDTKNWVWHWNVGRHRVKVQAFKRGRAENFPKLNLRVSCSCPFWRWWGPEHWGTEYDYQRGPLQGTASYPEIRDPARWRPVCKHAYAVLEKSMQFFVRPEKSPLKKLGSRFSVDSAEAIEIDLVNSAMTARVAQRHLDRQIRERVVARYLGKEED